MTSDELDTKGDRAQLDSSGIVHWAIFCGIGLVVLVLIFSAFGPSPEAYEAASDDIVTNCGPESGAGCGTFELVMMLPGVLFACVALLFINSKIQRWKNDE